MPKLPGSLPLLASLPSLLLAVALPLGPGLAEPPTGAPSPATAPAAQQTPGAVLPGQPDQPGQPAQPRALDGLNEQERELFWKVAKGELCPCGRATSLARCLQEAGPCPAALQTAVRIREWIGAGLGYGQIVDRLISALEELAEGKTFQLAEAACVGSADAVVLLVSFSDFECPHCRKAASLLHELVGRHPAKLRHCFQHFPLPYHPNARFAATVAEMLRLRNQFWPFHDRVFEAVGKGELSEEKIRSIAASLGVPLDREAEALIAAADRVEQQLEEGRQSGVNGTPSIFVNGRPLPHDEPLEKALDRLVEEELARAEKPGR